MSKRSKRATRHTEDEAFAALEAQIARVAADVRTAIPSVVAKAIANAVHPYQAHLAQQEKDALVAAHPGWGVAASLHVFPGVLT